MPIEPTLTRAKRNEDLRSLVLSPLTYVPRGGWLAVFDVLAGDRDELRTTSGAPNVTLISTIAGLERSVLTGLKTFQFGLGKKVMEALVTFMVEIHGHTRQQAEDELWDLVEADAPSARSKAVAA